MADETFEEAFEAMDLEARAGDADVIPAEMKAFIRGYRLVLWHFFHRPNFVQLPPRKQGLKELGRIKRAAEAVIFGLDEIDEGIYLYLKADHSVHFDQPDADVQRQAEEEGLMPAEIEHRQIVHLLKRLLEVVEITREETAPKKLGKRKKNEELENLVWRLSGVYERASGCAAPKGFYYDALSGQYEGPFVIFVENTLADFPHDFTLSNNAIGEIIRRALGKR